MPDDQGYNEKLHYYKTHPLLQHQDGQQHVDKSGSEDEPGKDSSQAEDMDDDLLEVENLKDN